MGLPSRGVFPTRRADLATDGRNPKKGMENDPHTETKMRRANIRRWETFFLVQDGKGPVHNPHQQQELERQHPAQFAVAVATGQETVSRLRVFYHRRKRKAMAAGRRSSRAAAPARVSNENKKAAEEAGAQATVNLAMASTTTTLRRRPTMGRRWTRRVVPHLVVVSLVLLLLFHFRATAEDGGASFSYQDETVHHHHHHHHSSSSPSLGSSLPSAATASEGGGGGDTPNATTSASGNKKDQSTCLAGESSSSAAAAASSGTAGTCGAATDGNDSNEHRLTAQQQQQQFQVPGVPTGADGLVEEKGHATQEGGSSVPNEPFWKPRPGDVVLPEGDSDDEEEEDDEYNEEYDEYNEEYDEEYEYDSADDEENDDDDDEYDDNDDDENDFVSHDRAEDLGVPQLVESPDVAAALDSARAYLRDTVMVDPFYEPVRTLCRNRDPSCALWATMGECQANPGYMNVSCAPVCHSCEKTHASTRCPVDPSVPDALYPGDLNRLFERAAADPALAHLQPKILSRPDFAPGDDPETAEYQLGLWLLQFDAFATPEECDRLVSFGMTMGYNRSADVGAEKEDGTFSELVNPGRTSTNAVRRGREDAMDDTHTPPSTRDGLTCRSFLFFSLGLISGATTSVTPIRWLTPSPGGWSISQESRSATPSSCSSFSTNRASSTKLTTTTSRIR